MGTAEPSLFESGVWLIPIILFAILFGLFLVVRRWKKITLQDLKYLRSELRHYQSERKRLAHGMRGYAPDDPEPYGSRLQALEQQFLALDQQITELELRHVNMQERVRHLASTRWQETVGAPYFWYELRRELAGLKKDRQSIQAGLGAAGEFTQTFDNLGWEVARQARAIQQLQGHASRRLEHLRGRGIHGEAMGQATRLEQHCQAELAKLPPYFYRGDEATVAEQASKGSVAEAHAILAEAHPALEELLEQAQTWEKQYQQATEQVAGMRQCLSNLEQTLTSMPPGIVLNPFNAQFDGLTVISNNLHATLARLEAESIPAVTAEAGRVLKTAQEMEEQLKDLRQQQAALEQILPELNAGLQRLSEQLSTLGTQATHPVVWEQSRVQLTRLSRQAAALEKNNRQRTAEQLSQDLENARQLNLQCQELEKHCQQIAQQHAEIVSLLTSPELSQSQEWLPAALQLTAQVEQYSPENWPRTDGVKNLPDELQAFEEGLHILEVNNPARPIPEAEAAQRARDLRELAQFSKRLHQRVGNIHTRLAEIRSAEEQAQAQLDGARKAINQIALLVRSNTFLSGIAAHELQRIQSSLQQASSELEQHAQGSIEKKVRNAGSLAGRVEQAANGWLEQLNREVEAEVKSLSGSVTNLSSIAMLDEPALAEARRLLTSGQNMAGSSSGQKPRVPLDEIVLELKRRSDFWQACTAAVRAIEDLETPILESYESASEYRTAARELLGETSLARGKRTWPPVSAAPDAERQEFARLEEQWEGVKRQTIKAIALVSTLSNLASKYQSVALRAQQAAERAAHEQAEIEGLETEIENLAQRWQGQWRNYRNNPLATDEIRKLLGEIEREREQVKQSYRQGALNYRQVQQALLTLRRKARHSQVAIDDDNVVDVDGRILPA